MNVHAASRISTAALSNGATDGDGLSCLHGGEATRSRAAKLKPANKQGSIAKATSCGTEHHDHHSLDALVPSGSLRSAHGPLSMVYRVPSAGGSPGWIFLPEGGRRNRNMQCSIEYAGAL